MSWTQTDCRRLWRAWAGNRLPWRPTARWRRSRRAPARVTRGLCRPPPIRSWCFPTRTRRRVVEPPSPATKKLHAVCPQETFVPLASAKGTEGPMADAKEGKINKTDLKVAGADESLVGSWVSHSAELAERTAATCFGIVRDVRGELNQRILGTLLFIE